MESDHLKSLYLKDDTQIDCKEIEENDDTTIPCIMCDEKFIREDTDYDDISVKLQHHSLTHHKLMIADINKIANLRHYCKFWKNKFKQCNDLSEIGPNDCGHSEQYYMIGGDDTVFKEDSDLRSRLCHENISSHLSQWQTERDDTSFSRRCLFCRKTFTGNRSVLFDHISRDHNFSIGHYDNIVNCYEFLDLLENKLTELRCLYCEKIFKSWSVLKEHMRKKGHKLLNPNNKEYDKYYLINYLNPGKKWQMIKEEDDRDNDDDADGDNQWNDWIDASNSDGICICLFCNYSSECEHLKEHLLNAHQFNFDSIISQLNFYSRIKLINYIRRCVHQKKCYCCGESFASRDDLLVHIEFSQNHTNVIPSEPLWNSPEYFFSTYENDNLLHFLSIDDDDDDDAADGAADDVQF